MFELFVISGFIAVFAAVDKAAERKKEQKELLDRMHPPPSPPPLPPPSRQERLDAAINNYNAALKKAQAIQDQEMRSEFIAAEEIRLRKVMMEE